MRTFTAVARRDGRWWAIEVPELGNVWSQALSIAEVEHNAREAIGVALELPPDSFSVEVRVATDEQ